MILPTVNANTIQVGAQSAVVMDSYTKSVLFSKNPESKRAVASTTKIMTCLIACESNKLNETVTITRQMLEGCEGSLIYLAEGDMISLYDLVCGAMIASGNDAANAISFYLSGDLHNFSEMMNNKAKSLGMLSTKFTTPSGLDKNGNHSTAYDMALLASYAAQNNVLMQIASMKSAQIRINDAYQTIYNHNKLLSYSDDFIGLKTGYTKKAGRCLVSAYKYEGSVIICVTLNDADDWEDHKRLVNYAKKCYKDINRKDELSIIVVGSDKDKIKCVCEYSVK
ncbi:MAG: D-alanyl-D-alanine carboxypeptidase, partial [Eubacterium sp.]|nr:D-alanyl-D-alanine carboxypeptidase [Eubacterium sp.]